MAPVVRGETNLIIIKGVFNIEWVFFLHCWSHLEEELTVRGLIFPRQWQISMDGLASDSMQSSSRALGLFFLISTKQQVGVVKHLSHGVVWCVHTSAPCTHTLAAPVLHCII